MTGLGRNFEKMEAAEAHSDEAAIPTESMAVFQILFEGDRTEDTEAKDTETDGPPDMERAYKVYQDLWSGDAGQTEETEEEIGGTACKVDEEKGEIKDETGWSDEIVENIQNTRQYEILRDARLREVEINGRKCLIREDVDLDYSDEDGVTNRDRMARGLSPIDGRTGQKIELHHLGQKEASPLAELTEEEHRTGEYQSGKKNQSLWHDNTVETEVHGEGNGWAQEKKAHWQDRFKQIEGDGQQ